MPSASDDTYSQAAFLPAPEFVLGCCWALLTTANELIQLLLSFCRVTGRCSNTKFFKSRFQKEVRDTYLSSLLGEGMKNKLFW